MSACVGVSVCVLVSVTLPVILPAGIWYCCPVTCCLYYLLQKEMKLVWWTVWWKLYSLEQPSVTVGKGTHATVPFHRQNFIFKHVASVFRVSSDMSTAPGFHDLYLNHHIFCLSLISISHFCLYLVKVPVSCLGLDLMFLLSLFFLCCCIAIVTAGDQSPSSPASRWPGANYGNRTLGACLSGPDALVLHSCWLHNSLICLVKTLKLSWSTTCRVTKTAV